ncbi:MBL fold metallo-hydrolase [Lacimicrobium alkaliphilum]|uniref:MBL fold metallo-hydrolase n=1 Tax=Lacimicrobium alkaliphilum TaxID=1526571 RepID=A0A0U3B895_9ALTE|nr:MBL fold metallo-hydrolase [Lacimicrobium alkaliphilum]ALS97877.1 MBL fold metallo-hydrolase [Lacimicrobium alkaliphilum]
MSLQVQAFFHQDTSTLSYLVFDEQAREAAIIDPALDFDYAAGHTNTEFADQLIQAVKDNELSLKWILETHAHADHLTAAQHIRAQLGGKIAIGSGITKVQENFQRLFNLGDKQDVQGRDFDHLFAEGDTFTVGRFHGRVITTPGHTNDSLTYLIGGNAFVGDSLFMPDAGTARCDFPGGSAELLFESVQKLYALDDDTRIYVCHDYQPEGRSLRYVATVAEHKANNIHINKDTTVEEFVQKRNKRDKTLGMPRLIIPSIQVNIRAGELPPAENNGVHYLKVPVNLLGC